MSYHPVDYRRRVVMPVYDMETGKKVFAIAFYGLTRYNLSDIDSFWLHREAMKRRGLDPQRYQINPLDVASCESHNYEPPEIRK
jgi:hypothetical protein